MHVHLLVYCTTHFVCRLKLIPTHEDHTVKMNSKVIVFVVLLCLTGFGLLMRGYMPKFPQLQHISHVACDKCLRKVDPWLKQHLHKSVQPFLSANYSLPEDAFNWWKVICHEKSHLPCSCPFNSRN